MAISVTSSTRFEAPLYLELIPSRRLGWSVVLGVAAGTAALMQMPLPLEYRFAVSLGLTAGLGWRWSRVVTTYPQKLRHLPDEGWSLLSSDGWYAARSLHATYLTRSLAIIEIELENGDRVRQPLLADQTDAESWRRLRRRLARQGS